MIRDPFDTPPELEAPPGSDMDRALRACLPEPLKSGPGVRGIIIGTRTSRTCWVAGSVVGPPCARCGSRVWLSPSSQRYPRPIPAAVCSDCLSAALAQLEAKGARA